MNWSAISVIVAVVGITATGVAYISELDAKTKELSQKIADVNTKTNNLSEKTNTIETRTNDLSGKVTNIANEVSAISGRIKGVPVGTVAFFDLNRCPNGWEVFKPGQGRVVVAATESTIRGLSFRKLGDQGGAETVKLTINQIPRHAHTISLPGRSGNKAFVNRTPAWGYDDWQGSQTTANTSYVGGSQAHENMPPYHVLLQCKKT